MARPPSATVTAEDARSIVKGKLQQKIAELQHSSDLLEAAVDRATAAQIAEIDRAQEANDDAIRACELQLAELATNRPFKRPTTAEEAELTSAIHALGAASAKTAAVRALLIAANKLVVAYDFRFGSGTAATASPSRSGMGSDAGNAPPGAAARRKPARAAARPATVPAPARTLDARPDTVDFRDQMFVPTLVEVPAVSNLEAYLRLGLKVLDQGREGACTGFGLAAVANYLARQREFRPYRGTALPDPLPPADEVSARMLYVLARRYDEWEGEDYDGSSARGAMKGWHKHGICKAALWKDASEPDYDLLTEGRARDALDRPLGAYSRVNHKDLVAMHAAISEVGVLYATARVHDGWNEVGLDGLVKMTPGTIGGHAFALVGYDRAGFWLQNSWGKSWGKNGLAHVSYADWLVNGTDVWVARLGAPVSLGEGGAARMMAGAPQSYASYIYASLRPHIVMIENDGRLKRGGAYGLTPSGLDRVLGRDMPGRIASWNRKRVLLYAHGGLVAEDLALQYAANYKQPALDAEVYPISFIWRSDAWTTLGNILRDAIGGRKVEGVLDATKDFMLDRLDDTLEPVARTLGGKALWDEMKENAIRATSSARGGARAVGDKLAELVRAGAVEEIHIAGHSAGAIFMAALASYLATEGRIATGPLAGTSGLGLQITSLSLWAPACTMGLFYQTYLPLLDAGRIRDFGLYTLKDEVEQDDNCVNLYNKSLLYLVSHAFERKLRLPFISGGEPLLGLTKDVERTADAMRVLRKHDWFLAPDGSATNAKHHGDFDDDQQTLVSTLARITGAAGKQVRKPSFSTRSGQDIRRSLAVTTALGD
jgi:hypothetical protein